MRTLLLGGTWSLGRLIAEDASQRGIDVAVFNHRRRPAREPQAIRHIQGDRTSDAALRAAIDAGPWDAVVDISGKVPGVVRRSAAALESVTDRYVSVSTVRVYRDWPGAPVTEHSQTLDVRPSSGSRIDFSGPDPYGMLKAGCELACREVYGEDRLLVVRLHEIIGQLEDSGPLLWWLRRARSGGEILVPAPDRALQAIDVHDVARFTVDLLEQHATGAFNVAAPVEARSFSSMIAACQDIVAAGTTSRAELVWADENWLVEQGVLHRTELPLWFEGEAAWNVSVDRAVRAGLRSRSLAETIAFTWRAAPGVRAPNHPRIAQYGLPPEREAELIARWRARG